MERDFQTFGVGISIDRPDASLIMECYFLRCEYAFITPLVLSMGENMVSLIFPNRAEAEKFISIYNFNLQPELN